MTPVASDGPEFETVNAKATDSPTRGELLPTDRVNERSAVASRVSLSVAALLSGAGSAAPVGTAAVAVFTSSKEADGAIDATTEYVKLPPAGTVTNHGLHPLQETSTPFP